jgi:hypothetical protein
LRRFACYCRITRSTKEYEHAKIEPRTQKFLCWAPPEIRCPPAIATSAARSKLRAPDQPKPKIDVVYGDAKGNLEVIAQAARAMLLLEMVARRESDQLA